MKEYRMHSSTLTRYTIIIPHNNIPDLLKNCLSTIPIREDIQVIIVDDNSNEFNKNKVKEIESEYKSFEFYYFDYNKGAGAARNYGLEKAKGKWIIFVDSDDLLIENAAFIWDNYTELYHSYDILFFQEKCISEYKSNTYNSLKIKNIKRLCKIEKELNKYLKYCVYQPWSKLFSYEFIKKYSIKFQESEVANDMYFSILTGFYSTKIKFIPQQFYIYIIRPNSLSFNEIIDSKKLLSRIKVFYSAENFYKKNKILLRPFTLYLIYLKRILKEDQFRNILYDIYNDLNYRYSYWKCATASILQVPRKIFEFFRLPISGIKF
ncbi:MAG: glycosyltransferase family 2 protein [Muribaculaceae bacterium]|nr:glycosyltransferase family 2 protein [Muribaculaceae bacterium]